ncbi:MAG: hypothetical protein Q9226_002317 [Calogaya cf. arnoldii]
MSENSHTSATSSSSSTTDDSPLAYSPLAGTTENARKRKRPASQGSDTQRQISRPKPSYNTEYHGLLNDTIRDLHPGPLTSTTHNAHITQVGMCRWSSHERGLLFGGLARYGADSLPAIVALIGTKSEPEVHTYLRSLKAASVKQHMYGKRQSLVRMADIPAAVELSEDCCTNLEQAADSLATLQQRHEEHSEEQMHGDLWKLDQDKARWIEWRMCESEEGKSEIHERVPAAELLNLGQMLELSRNLFMNAADRDINWHSLSSRSDSPALQYTAFSDLHNIAVSITTRLTQTALFFAMSRLRATKSKYYLHQCALKRCDVLAAINVLGMKESAREGWVQVARRCKLEVYDQARGTVEKTKLNYSEVERVLRGEEYTAEARAKLGGSTCDENDSNPESISEDGSVSLAATSNGSCNPSTESNTNIDRNEPADKFGTKTDVHLDSIDQQASEKEETRLWKMLGKDPPSNLSSQKSTQTEDPGPHRHNRNDLDDWRDRVDLKSEWEVYDVQHLGASLKNNQDEAQLEEGALPKPATSNKRRGRVRSERISQCDTSSANDRESTDLGSSTNVVYSSTNDGSSNGEEPLDSTENEGPEDNQ